MNNVTINCFLCNTSFEKFKGEYDRQIRKGNTRFFCSKECVRQHIKNVTNDAGKILRLENETCYNQSPKRCPQCDSIISYDSRLNNFCSHKCGALYTQKNGGNCHWSDDDKKRISIHLKDFYKLHPVTDDRKNKISNSLKKFHNNDTKIVKVITKKSPKNYTIHYKIRCKKITKINCKICNKELKLSPCFASKRKYCSYECYKADIKNGHLKGKSGGYRERGGRGKQGWYKGYYCHSTWELAWVIYQLEHSIPFVRNTQGFEYDLDGKKHKFYPDFIVNNEYVEIKGWDNGQVKAKLSQFPHKLIVLRSKEMKPYLEYSHKKYGDDLEKLYEKKI